VGRQDASALGQAVLAFLAMPTMVGMFAPWFIAAGDPWRGSSHPAGVALAGVGLGSLLWCVRDFYVVGKGTLAPRAPPRRLVVVGLYRYVRNPMHLSVLVIVAGIAWWKGSPLVGLYAFILAIAYHLRVVLHEEPRLARSFDADWPEFSRAVPRWVPTA
jgi:protein-S-isoprenylcysteine O-methyltransferase Ste14